MKLFNDIKVNYKTINTVCDLVTSCLRASMAIKLMKAVICSRKSNKTAIAAYRANSLTAGMSVNAPGIQSDNGQYIFHYKKID